MSQPKELIGAFVNMRQGMPYDAPWGNYTALGLVRNDTLVCGVIYNNGADANLCMHIGAVEGRRWCNQEFLFAAFDYPFNQLGMRRVTACVRSTNTRTRAFVENLGFTYEGTMRAFYKDSDMILYGMLRDECRHLLKKAA